MIKNTNFGLLNDSIIGYLLCVYLRLNAPVEDKHYFIINQTDPLITAVPDNLKQLGICDIKRTFGIKLIEVTNKYEGNVRLYSELSVTAQNSNSNHYRDKLKLFKGLLSKYKVHGTPVDYSKLVKLDNDKEINKCLAYVISFNDGQYKKLSKFLKQYIRLFLEKELDGQQHYTLPQLYIDSILDFINNPEYIKLFGYKNLQLNKKDNIFFCHAIMVLVMQKKIKIRKMYVTDQSVHVIFDNFIRSAATTPNEPAIKNPQPTWRDDFIWQGKKFVFGAYGSIDFDSPDRESLFRKLTNAQGHWVKVSVLKGNKDDSFVRPTISQIESRFEPTLKKHVSIPSQEDDDLPGKPEGHGAYRIKFSPKP